MWLVRRPLRGAGDAALVSAVGLTAAIVLNPTTRFGYFLYPVAYVAIWYAARVSSVAASTSVGAEMTSRDTRSGRTQDT